MGKRSVGGLLSCAALIVTLSGCATGTLTSPSSVTTGPATSTGAITSTVLATPSSAAASDAEQARRAAASAAVQSSPASGSAQAARAAAQSAAEDAAAQALSDGTADEQAPVDQVAPVPADPSTGADTAAADAPTADTPPSQLSEADALAHGWYDEFGWISPDTAARALAAGIPLGANVPENLRCGTACGENPTAAEIEAQKSAEAESAASAATQTAPTCPYMVVRGVCYSTPSEAAAAGE